MFSAGEVLKADKCSSLTEAAYKTECEAAVGKLEKSCKVHHMDPLGCKDTTNFDHVWVTDANQDPGEFQAALTNGGFDKGGYEQLQTFVKDGKWVPAAGASAGTGGATVDLNTEIDGVCTKEGTKDADCADILKRIVDAAEKKGKKPEEIRDNYVKTSQNISDPIYTDASVSKIELGYLETFQNGKKDDEDDGKGAGTGPFPYVQVYVGLTIPIGSTAEFDGRLDSSLVPAITDSQSSQQWGPIGVDFGARLHLGALVNGHGNGLVGNFDLFFKGGAHRIWSQPTKRDNGLEESRDPIWAVKGGVGGMYAFHPNVFMDFDVYYNHMIGDMVAGIDGVKKMSLPGFGVGAGIFGAAGSYFAGGLRLEYTRNWSSGEQSSLEPDIGNDAAINMFMIKLEIRGGY